ncbi:MAG: HAD family hydrolase [Dehalococcoidia bacterium]
MRDLWRGRTAIFLDMDGVLVDNGPPLAAAYTRAVSEVLAARLGGDVAAWARAHETSFANLPAAPDGPKHFAGTPMTPSEMYRLENLLGVRGACAVLGVTPPPEDECDAWGHEMEQRARFEYSRALPGAAPAVEAMADDVALHMSSGNAAWVIAGTLEHMAISEHFGLGCGADLVGVVKAHDDFFPRVFDLADARAQDAIVVDDRADVLARAKRAGAATVLVGAPSAGGEADLVVGSLADLPGVLGF